MTVTLKLEYFKDWVCLMKMLTVSAVYEMDTHYLKGTPLTFIQSILQVQYQYKYDAFFPLKVVLICHFIHFLLSKHSRIQGNASSLQFLT